MESIPCINKTLQDKSLKNAFRNAAYLLFKRIFDVFVSLIFLPFAIIIIGFFGAFIKLESQGPVIYSQERVGKNGKIFTIYKLRSMYIKAEDNGPQWAVPYDPRVTRIGRFIRNTRIDEIPQIINILKGDMSIVGPRPERHYFVNKFIITNPDFIDRLKVKPGLTGWAQVNGGYELSIKEKLEKDLYYIKHQSLWMDFIIILNTFKVVIGRMNAR